MYALCSCMHAAMSLSCRHANSLVGLLQGLSRGVSGQSPEPEQVEQLQSELQQRCGQLQKLSADLEYSQDELQDLQRHCRSLEVCLCCPANVALLAGLHKF